MSILKTTSRPRPWAVLCTGMGASLWALTVAAAAPSAGSTQDATQPVEPVRTHMEALPIIPAAIEFPPAFSSPIEAVGVTPATPVLDSPSGRGTRQRTCWVDRMRGSFDGALVIAMGCDATGSSRTAQSFINKGAEAFIGWNELVSATHTDLATEALLRLLVEDDLSAHEAVAQTMSEVGPDPAYNSELHIFPES